MTNLTNLRAKAIRLIETDIDRTNSQEAYETACARIWMALSLELITFAEALGFVALAAENLNRIDKILLTVPGATLDFDDPDFLDTIQSLAEAELAEAELSA